MIVLAAGSSSRFGATKLLAPVDRRPLVAPAVRTALGADAADVVVTGHDGNRVAAAARVEGDLPRGTQSREPASRRPPRW